MVITGITPEANAMTQPQKVVYQSSERSRATIDLSPAVSLLLDHVCEVTGSNKSQIVLTALMDALPGLLERSDSLQKRSTALAQSLASKKR
jgi:alpha-D-ribose 1-methylphosphonate 5-triphosphate synthase subunit PhnG